MYMLIEVSIVFLVGCVAAAFGRSFLGALVRALLLQGAFFLVFNLVLHLGFSLPLEGARGLLILILTLALTRRKKSPSPDTDEQTTRQPVVPQEHIVKSSQPVKQTFKMVPTDESDLSGKGL
jgi:hypothetical protein